MGLVRHQALSFHMINIVLLPCRLPHHIIRIVPRYILQHSRLERLLLNLEALLQMIVNCMLLEALKLIVLAELVRGHFVVTQVIQFLHFLRPQVLCSPSGLRILSLQLMNRHHPCLEVCKVIVLRVFALLEALEVLF